MNRIRHTRTNPLPSGARYVGRPSAFGNPFRVVDHGRDQAIRLFRQYAENRLSDEPRWLNPLRDATALACWCPTDLPCHADVLIDLIERSADERG